MVALRRHRKRHLTGEVELNLAAMLDMAFQLLTFFILTFKPAPAEVAVKLHLPPPSVTVVEPDGKPPRNRPANKDPVAALNTLTITVLGTPSGSVRQMLVGQTPVPGLADLDARLSSVLRDPSSTFDQVLIQVGSGLHYNALMQVIDVCTRQRLANGQNLTKLSFVELADG